MRAAGGAGRGEAGGSLGSVAGPGVAVGADTAVGNDYLANRIGPGGISQQSLFYERLCKTGCST